MTPGPWQIKSDYEAYTIVGNIDGPDDGRMHFTYVCEAQDEDDVRLIAAAPEMLEALNAALLWLGAEDLDDIKDPREKIRAAIAKAEGRS
jgi:hypothetical protein